MNRNSAALRRRLGATVVALWAWVTLLAPAAAQESTVTLSSNPATDACMQNQACLQQVFLGAALGGGQERLAKWTVPVRAGVYAASNLPKDRQAIGARALEIMSSVGRTAGANLHAANDDPDNPINLIIFVSDDFERDRDGRFAPVIDQIFGGRGEIYDSLLAGQGPICASRWSLDQALAVSVAVAMAQTDLPPDGFEQCLYSTMMKMLGLTGAVPDHLDSILNPAARNSTWTALDFILLGLLYHPLIEPGMTPRRIGEVFPWAYAEVIQKAG